MQTCITNHFKGIILGIITLMFANVTVRMFKYLLLNHAKIAKPILGDI